MSFRIRAWNLLTFSVALLSLHSHTALADHGGCPCATGSPDDATIDIAEPAQRAVVLWNGQTEQLLLATDIALTVAREGSAVEFIPLPSKPSAVHAESTQVLDRVVEWATDRRIDVSHFASALPKGTLRHDPFPASITQPFQLAQQMIRVCAFTARFQSGVAGIAASYLQRGFAWFVIDQIDVDSKPRSFPPISYRFASQHLYYPLETSTAAVGITHIELILITPSGVSDLGTESRPVNAGPATVVDTESLGTIDAEWPALFSQPTVAVQHVVIDGALGDLRFDLMSK